MRRAGAGQPQDRPRPAATAALAVPASRGSPSCEARWPGGGGQPAGEERIPPPERREGHAGAAGPQGLARLPSAGARGPWGRTLEAPPAGPFPCGLCGGVQLSLSSQRALGVLLLGGGQRPLACGLPAVPGLLWKALGPTEACVKGNALVCRRATRGLPPRLPLEEGGAPPRLAPAEPLVHSRGRCGAGEPPGVC